MKKKRVLSLLLCLCMLLSLFPVTALAAESPKSFDDPSGKRTVDQKEYNIAPGIKEYEWVLNNSNLSEQMVGHVMEVSLSEQATIIAGYSDYNIDSIASGNAWQMMKPTEQAEHVETRTGQNVVGVINAAGFNMSNGCPTGALVMDGRFIKEATGTTFWIGTDNQARITDKATFDAAVAAGEVREAVSAFSYGGLVRDGECVSGLDNSTRASRTAVGIKADGTVVMYMVNGRQAPYSVGMTMAELAEAMKALGCVAAENLDGGGSSMFATQREGEEDNNNAGLTMRCRPSDGVERTVSSSLMVVSTAQSDGVFDHASISPSQEVYTPGSTVQFTATGVDGGGYPVDLPGGLTWEASAGSITADGVYTAPDTTGSVTVMLKNGSETVGRSTIELQWPDQLGFTNANVSLDFGQESDLTFNPTYQGRPVHYKDGDFTWSLDESQPISYKYNALVETKAWYPSVNAYRTQAANGNAYRIFISLTGSNTQQAVEWGLYETRTYKTYFTQTESNLTYQNNTICVNATVSHDKAEKLIGSEWVEAPAEELAQEFYPTHSFAVGRFEDNHFVADEDNSLRATVKVALASDSGVVGSVDVVVGMDPLLLMDFEDCGDTTAEDYWDICITNRSNGSSGQLTAEQVEQYGLWARTATTKPVDFDGSELVSAAEDSRVRFGEHAFKLCFDFSNVSDTDVASMDFGYSCDLYVDTVQPTKIGMWVNVPKALEDCPYLLKAIMAGGVTSETGNASLAGYNRLNADGSFTFVPGTVMPKGTTMYTQYYGTAADGTKLTTIGDLAGRGWTWVEADISSMQMPIDVYRAYTVRVVKTATMTYKAVGEILVDNIQFIYGTNTNDINNPDIESITAKTGADNTLLSEDGVILHNGAVAFEVLFDDSEQTDKYATGIDNSTIRITVDGKDYTDQVQLFESSLTLAGLTLLNGTHTIAVTMKDYYGNQSTLSRTFTVDDAVGKESALSVEAPEGETPVLGKDFCLSIINKSTMPVVTAAVKLDIPDAYQNTYAVTWGDGYTGTSVYENGGIFLTIQKAEEATTYVSELASITFPIPGDTLEGTNFTYTVSAGSYENADGTATFSEAECKLPITAPYNVEVVAPIADVETTLYVTDQTGAAVIGATVYVDGNPVAGTTDELGQLTYTFPAGGRVTVYASTEQGRSWNESVVVSEAGDDYYNAPFGIQNNGTQNPQQSQSITWLCNIATSDEDPAVRYGTDSTLVEYQEVKGTSKLLTFTESDSGTALRANTVQLTDLTSGTIYYYQVGSGENWSDIRTFATTAENAETTNFFVLGDIQTSVTANLAAVVNRLAGSQYDFGIQTGDAIDGVNKLDEWRGFLTTLNSSTLNGVDLIHTLGNHEYYGDAQGLISGTIYDLPESDQNSWYQMEYGNVCVVVVNNGTSLADTLEEIAQKLTTSCAWRILTVHEPVYGTTDVMDAEKLSRVTAAVEDAGFDFVFSGDDHSYARTYPMLNGVAQTENSREGVVYFISGDLSSKSNAFTKQDAHVVAKSHNDYTGAYITAQATAEKITITAYDYNGNEMDSYTETRSGCEMGQHTLNSSSAYDMETKTLTCAACGATQPVGTYSGLVSTADGKQTILVNGSPKVSDFTQLGGTVYHSDSAGYAHLAENTSTLTCTKGGHQIYRCAECNIEETVGQFIMPSGHDWDEQYVCTVCGTRGKNIEDADVIVNFGTVDKPRESTSIPSYEFKAGGVRPTSFVSVDGGITALKSSNDNNVGSDGVMLDLFVEWPGNNEVGQAQIKYTGRGDYYGTRTLTYNILPGKSTLETVSKDDSSISLKWSAAAGGADYYEVFACDKNNSSNSRKLAAKVTEGTACTIQNLAPETEYYFVVGARKTADSQLFTSPWSNILTVKTEAVSGEIAGVSATVDGAALSLISLDGENYLLLPASANLEDLTLCFTVPADKGSIVLSGSKGEVTLTDYEDQVNVLEIAALSGGCYSLTAQIGNGTALNFKIMHASGIPTMYLTSGVEGQDREYVDADKSHETTGSLLMVQDDGTPVYTGSLKQIKARGNSTFAHYPKKSYQIKLSTPTDLLGNQEEVKTWVLLANYGDATLMHDKFFKDLANGLGMPYVANSGWVNLYYDGEYRGVYLLSEKNAVNSTSVDILDMEDAYESLNADYGKNAEPGTASNAYGQSIQYTVGLTEPEDLSGGYLIELNHNYLDEVSGFHTRKGVAFNVKSPEWAGKDAMTYISEFYQEFEDAVYAVDVDGNYTGYNGATGKYFYDYVDMDSLVKIFVMQELALNPDGFISSLYFYKDAGGKMYAGPIWDQDMSLGTGWTKKLDADQNYQYHYLAEALIQIPAFRKAVEDYYAETFAPEVNALLESRTGYIDEAADLLADNAAMNYLLWDYIRVGDPSVNGHIWENVDYGDVITDMKDWIRERIGLLDTVFAKTPDCELITDLVPGIEVSVNENSESGNVEFTLETPDDAPEGLIYLVWVSGVNDDFDQWETVTAADGVYSAETTGSEMVVHVYILGDVNMDGQVSVGDASSLLRGIANDENLTGLNEFLADFNGDKQLGVGDASSILRFIANS